MKRHLALVGIIFSFSPDLYATSIYKCTSEKGTVVFSESPCNNQAEKIEVSVPKIGTEGSTNATNILKTIEKHNRPREIDQEIKELETQIADDQKKMDLELDNLREQKKYAANNLAGATWEESISTEMQAVVEKYKTRISNARSQIEYLRAEKQRVLSSSD
ncbi:DUF4124 domain-containing protein [Hahella ganghwensis]|uniref:DUF4124 domain-containing protein n=1 Tax=Hahella ganghwensis TaxID=286420 RepID=UPI00036FE0C7|nr:DUF4124 domain-containing protein [Hahella ganghwensis]